ncbi:hypothetical protein [Aquimarina sp. 2201CG5-10]|uniref:hypothetical protein n=1 Tax=Aquimarina callyspongiae TaxID=3098150 RepID=UPI002AB5B3A2|nr:hypothetical protein [Aquimarina sp. 2201CG5-10]MDY8134085.1 hypothetical protein [Aquimarina sp. 2201CG5-10]
MRITNDKIKNPTFIISVFVLIINDWFLKSMFHNVLTGKLSDFAGLFAFPFFLSAIFYKQKRSIHILTALFFMIWKSEFFQPVIDVINTAGIPVYRTVDYTDYIALISVFVSYQVFKQEWKVNMKPVLSTMLIIVSSLAFMSTTMIPREERKYIDINKEYQFDFSKRELVSRLNMIQMKEVNRINKYSGQVDFDSETNIFHYKGQTDTLAIILDDDMIRNQDTIRIKSSFADIQISGDENQSKLKLITAYRFVSIHKDKDYRNRTIKEFERRIVKKIKRYR